MTERTILLIPDLHIPDHHVKATNNLVRFIAEYQPDEIVNLGDFMDCLAPARWSRDTAAEFADTLQSECDAVVKFDGMVRDVFDGPYRKHDGNHVARIRAYINAKAPAFASLDALQVENLLDYRGLDIERLDTFYDVAPGWVTTHGDVGSLSRYAGGTAVGIARKIRKSVACGHTHRAGIVNESAGYQGKLSTLTGMECGNLMDIRRAGYLKTGAANWQMGFGLLYVHGRHVTPSLIHVAQNGAFAVEGVSYGL